MKIMKSKVLQLSFLLLFFQVTAFSQDLTHYTWWNPFANKVPGTEVDLKKGITGKAGSGMSLIFTTNATDLIIRYVVKNDSRSLFPAMPMTGATGVNLYAIDQNGKWVSMLGDSSFADTIVYRFYQLKADKSNIGKEPEYRLFLPLCNKLEWMEIGVADSSIFNLQPLSEKPIVVYGNVITSNSAVSRLGLNWTALLEKKLDRPFLHFDIPKNNVERKALTSYISKTDAALYMLDCGACEDGKLTGSLFCSTLAETVRQLRKGHTNVPILLIQHNSTSTVRQKELTKMNGLLKRVFAELKSSGIKNIYQLADTAIHLTVDGTTDGRSLNDASMQQWATACENRIRLIMQEPVGQITTTLPVVQSRDGFYNWRKRHAEILTLNKTEAPLNVIMGNSIIHFWGGALQGSSSRGDLSWNQWLKPLGLRNMGFGWDRIENVLWRVYHRELDGFTARHVVLMIGTNNLSVNTDEEIIEGLDLLVRAVRQRQPFAKILLSGLLPRRNMEERVTQLNLKIKQLAALTGVAFINTGTLLLNDQEKIDESLFGDGLHPNAKGYQIIAPALAEYLKN
jgi:lysophospholipase L1-like esterase